MAYPTDLFTCLLDHCLHMNNYWRGFFDRRITCIWGMKTLYSVHIFPDQSFGSFLALPFMNQKKKEKKSSSPMSWFGISKILKHSVSLKRLNLKEERLPCSCSCCGATILNRLNMKEVWYGLNLIMAISHYLRVCIKVGWETKKNYISCSTLGTLVYASLILSLSKNDFSC